MRSFLKLLALVGIASCWSAGAHAQFMALTGAGTIIIKSGESIDVGEVYYVSQCRSLLKSPPEVEVLDGPSTVSVSIREADILPRRQGCSKKIPGGIFVITAKDVDDPSFTHLSVRFNYKTKDGDRKFGHVFNLQLIP